MMSPQTTNLASTFAVRLDFLPDKGGVVALVLVFWRT